MIPVTIEMHKAKTFIFIFALFFSSALFAQRLELGLTGGGASYLGDMNQYQPLKISGLSAGGFVKLNFNPRFALGVHYNYGQIEANDSKSENEQFRDRNLSFQTSLKEISLMGELNLFDMHKQNARKFSPFLFVGIGNVFFQPTTVYDGVKYSLANYNTEGQEYSLNAITIPYGLGFKYRLTENLTLSNHIGYRTAFTDYIDDVSGNYSDTSTWGTSADGVLRRALADRSGEKTGVFLGVPGTQRGDYRKRDTYMFVGIGISYTFVSQKCFTF